MRRKFKYTWHPIHKVVSVAILLTMMVTLPTYDGSVSKSGITGTTDVFATTAKEKKKKAEQDLDKVKKDINNLEDAKTEVQSNLNSKANKLKKLLEKQEALEKEIIAKQSEINQCTLDLEQAQDDKVQQYEEMKLRIRFMYENSTEDAIWTAIVESNGIADMLNRIEYVTSVYKSDRALMKKYQKVVKSVEKLSEKLGCDMSDLLVMQEKYEGQQMELERMIFALQSEKAEYATQIASAEKRAENYKKIIAEQGAIIQAQEAAAAAAAAAEAARRQAASEYQGGGAGTGGVSNSVAYLNDSSYNPSNRTNISGESIVNYALQFVGNPYVWGGNSLTNGCDCSGFVHLVYQHFGISTPRYSQAFKNVGQPVAYANLRAGDVVVYPGHVAIYIGNGCIVEAQSTRAGITQYRRVNCHTITAIRRLV